jgi:hypothetical protein
MAKKTVSWTMKRHVLYDFRRGRLATRKMFASRHDGIVVARALGNVVVLPLLLQAVTAGSPQRTA